MKLNFKGKIIILVAVGAIIVGALYALPQGLIWRSLSDSGEPYVSIQLTHRGDMNQVYMPKAREVYDGHFPPSDLHINENNLPPTIFPALPALLFLPFLVASSGDASLAMLLADFFLPAIIFVLFFTLGKVFLKKNIWAYFLALVGTLTPLAIHLPKAFNGLENFGNLALKNFYPLVNTKLDKLFLDRIDDPLLTYLIFLPAIVLVALFWRNPTIGRGVAAGLFVGLLAYTYFHYWVFMMVLSGLLIILLLAINSRKDNFKPAAALLITLIVVLVPYAVSYIGFNNLPGAADYIARVEIEEGRFFRLFDPFPVIFDYIVYLVVAALVWLAHFRTGEKRKAQFYFAALATSFIIWNLQLIVGFMPHPDHFARAISVFLLIMIFDLAIAASSKLNRKYIYVGLAILSVLLVGKKVVNSFHFINPAPEYVTASTSRSYTLDANIVKSWDWIDANLPKDAKLASNSLVTSYYLLSYTSSRPYLPTGFNSLLSSSEIARRFLEVNKLFNVESKVVEGRLKAGISDFGLCSEDCDFHSRFNQIKGSQHMFVNQFRKETDEWRYVDEQFAKMLLTDYDDLRLTWQDLDADYVYLGPWEREFGEGRIFDDSELDLIYRNESVQIFKINK